MPSPVALRLIRPIPPQRFGVTQWEERLETARPEATRELPEAVFLVDVEHPGERYQYAGGRRLAITP